MAWPTMRLPSLTRLLATAPVRADRDRCRDELAAAWLLGCAAWVERRDEEEGDEEEADESERAGDVDRLDEAVDASAVVAVERT